MKISLRKVTLDNFDDIVDLPLLPHQEDWLASNDYSIAEASLNPALRTHAIYAGEQVIGFALYRAAQPGDEEPGSYEIWRIMIAATQQGHGYGRQALELILHEICADPATQTIHICYMPDNDASRRFYASLGFEERGVDEDGEVDAVVTPAGIRWSRPAGG